MNKLYEPTVCTQKPIEMVEVLKLKSEYEEMSSVDLLGLLDEFNSTNSNSKKINIKAITEILDERNSKSSAGLIIAYVEKFTKGRQLNQGSTTLEFEYRSKHSCHRNPRFYELLDKHFENTNITYEVDDLSEHNATFKIMVPAFTS